MPITLSWQLYKTERTYFYFVITAILVDDEINVRNLLRILLKEHCPEISVLAECSDLPEAVKSIRKNKPNLVFLDIEMPGHSGLELLDFFNDDEIDFHIIFTTAYSEYAVQAFELSAVGYLLKPIKADKLKDTIERFKKLEKKNSGELQQLNHNLQHTQNKRITLITKYKTYFVELNTIMFIKGEGAYSEFNLIGGEKVLVSKNLKHYEDMLTIDKRFVRISKQSIINKDYLIEISKNGGHHVILKNNVSLAISPDKEQLLF